MGQPRQTIPGLQQNRASSALKHPIHLHTRARPVQDIQNLHACLWNQLSKPIKRPKRLLQAGQMQNLWLHPRRPWLQAMWELPKLLPLPVLRTSRMQKQLKRRLEVSRLSQMWKLSRLQWQVTQVCRLQQQLSRALCWPEFPSNSLQDVEMRAVCPVCALQDQGHRRKCEVERKHN